MGRATGVCRFLPLCCPFLQWSIAEMTG
jgi:hypothetical protein